MRSHVGGHILKDEIGTSRTCGFCGEDKIKTSKKLNKVFYSLEDSDCPYGRIKVFNKKKNRCTNRIAGCSVKGCKSIVWIYHMEKNMMTLMHHVTYIVRKSVSMSLLCDLILMMQRTVAVVVYV